MMNRKTLIHYHGQDYPIHVIKRVLRNTQFNSLLRYFTASNKEHCVSMKPISEKKKNMWRRTGNYYGYPKCCVEDFCSGNFTNRTPAQKEFFKNQNGFIPCPKHAEELLTGKITIERLLKSRKHKRPFPYDY